MDGLLKRCCDLNVGAMLGKSNVCCLAYCDDLLLLSPVKNQMDQLLKTCFDFAYEWKIRFNTEKSISYSLRRPEGAYFYFDGTSIPSTDVGFIYLRMPIGTHEFSQSHFETKFKSLEKAYYSLRGIGCRYGMSSPRSMAFIDKQFCQSILARFALLVLPCPSVRLSVCRFIFQANIFLLRAILAKNLKSKKKDFP